MVDASVVAARAGPLFDRNHGSIIDLASKVTRQTFHCGSSVRALLTLLRWTFLFWSSCCVLTTGIQICGGYTAILLISWKYNKTKQIPKHSESSPNRSSRYYLVRARSRRRLPLLPIVYPPPRNQMRRCSCSHVRKTKHRTGFQNGSIIGLTFSCPSIAAVTVVVADISRRVSATRPDFQDKPLGIYIEDHFELY